MAKKIKDSATVAGGAVAGGLVGGAPGAAVGATSMWAGNNIRRDNKSIGSNSGIMQTGGGQIDFSVNPFAFKTTQQHGGNASVKNNYNQADKIIIDNNVNIKTPEGVVTEDNYTKWMNESTKPIEFNNSINRNGKY